MAAPTPPRVGFSSDSLAKAVQSKEKMWSRRSEESGNHPFADRELFSLEAQLKQKEGFRRKLTLLLKRVEVDILALVKSIDSRKKMMTGDPRAKKKRSRIQRTMKRTNSGPFDFDGREKRREEIFEKLHLEQHDTSSSESTSPLEKRASKFVKKKTGSLIFSNHQIKKVPKEQTTTTPTPTFSQTRKNVNDSTYMSLEEYIRINLTGEGGTDQLEEETGASSSSGLVPSANRIVPNQTAGICDEDVSEGDEENLDESLPESVPSEGEETNSCLQGQEGGESKKKRKGRRKSETLQRRKREGKKDKEMGTPKDENDKKPNLYLKLPSPSLSDDGGPPAITRARNSPTQPPQNQLTNRPPLLHSPGCIGLKRKNLFYPSSPQNSLNDTSSPPSSSDSNSQFSPQSSPSPVAFSRAQKTSSPSLSVLPRDSPRPIIPPSSSPSRNAAYSPSRNAAYSPSRNDIPSPSRNAPPFQKTATSPIRSTREHSWRTTTNPSPGVQQKVPSGHKSVRGFFQISPTHPKIPSPTTKNISFGSPISSSPKARIHSPPFAILSPQLTPADDISSLISFEIPLSSEEVAPQSPAKKKKAKKRRRSSPQISLSPRSPHSPSSPSLSSSSCISPLSHSAQTAPSYRSLVTPTLSVASPTQKRNQRSPRTGSEISPRSRSPRPVASPSNSSKSSPSSPFLRSRSRSLSSHPSPSSPPVVTSLYPSSPPVHPDKIHSLSYNLPSSSFTSTVSSSTPTNTSPTCPSSSSSSPHHFETPPPSPSSSLTWTERFQACIQKVRSVTMESRLDEVIGANTKLMHLSDDFVHAARTYGKIIISEVFLPVEKKTIRPRTIGGIVGGEKYIVHNILFKFAFDNDKVFGGNDAAATKVSEQELKGLMTFFSLDLLDLYFPMMALVRYRGFTLIAMTLLPVDRSTLVYGTHDGGVTVHNSEPKFSQVMKIAGQKLNLRPHLCGAKARNVKELWCAADIEGHVGFDNNFYLLDFGRAMPPMTPNKKFHNGHIYQLFRREFVMNHSKPLCSDACSGFVRHDPNLREYAEDIDAATQYLYKTVIPNCARMLIDLQNSGEIGSIIPEILHQNGVNLRLMGKILGTFHAENLMVASFYGEKMIQKLGWSLLVEATARVIKNQLNAKLRELVKEVREPVEVVYRQLVVGFLNLIFGPGVDSKVWWTLDLAEDLTKHFSVLRYFVNEERADGVLRERSTWRAKVLEEPSDPEDPGTSSLRYRLFSRVVELCEIHVTEEALRKFREPGSFGAHQTLELLDVIELRDRVKHMDVVSRTKGMFFLLKAVKESDKGVASSFLLRSISHYKTALTSMPNYGNALLQCAMAWFRYLEIAYSSDLQLGNEFSNQTGQTPVPSPRATTTTQSSFEPNPIFLDLSDPKVQEAEELFHRLLFVDDQNPVTLCLCGKFFQCCHKFDLAEECFLRGLEADSSWMFARVCYGLFFYLHIEQRLGMEILGSATNLLTNESLLDQLLGWEWTVVIDVCLRNGSKKSVQCPINISAETLLQKVCSIKEEEEGKEEREGTEEQGEKEEWEEGEQRTGVMVEVMREKDKSSLERLPYSTWTLKKGVSLREVGNEESPWLILKRKRVLIYCLYY